MANPAQKIFVTGSHIPSTLDAGMLPPSISPIRVYSRQELVNTGRGFDTAAALRSLDPSLR